MKKYTGTIQQFIMVDNNFEFCLCKPIPARRLALLKNSPRDYWDKETDGWMITATQVKMALGMGLAVIRQNIKDYMFEQEEVLFIATPLHPKGLYKSFQYFD
jgi:hypothetical protein